MMGYWLASVSSAQIRGNLPNSLRRNANKSISYKNYLLMAGIFCQKIGFPMVL
jgi:hypothetical protein